MKITTSEKYTKNTCSLKLWEWQYQGGLGFGGAESGFAMAPIVLQDMDPDLKRSFSGMFSITLTPNNSDPHTTTPPNNTPNIY